MKIVVPIILLFLSSCVSIKNNYLGRTKTTQKNSYQEEINFVKLDSLRSVVDKNADSLVRVFKENEKQKTIRFATINHLFENFAIEMDYDRIYHAMLQKNSNKKNKDAYLIYYSAATKLLQSAAFYNTYYEKSGRVRRALNRGDIGNNIPKNIIQKSRKFLYSSKVRKEIRKHPQLPELAFVDSALTQLPNTNFIKSSWVKLYRKNDRLINMLYGTFSFVGKTFFGKPSAIRLHRKKEKKMIDALAANLQPFDIILCKSDNQLATTFVDGYYGHAALWIGEDISKKRNVKHLLDSTYKTKPITKYHKGIIEAVRSGVRICSLKKFLEGEEYLIIRPSISNEQKKRLINNAGKQLNKAYDFNFDINSPDEINCTELIYLSCDFIPWETSTLMGRSLMLPDDVFKTALDKKQLEIVTFIKGDIVKKNPQPMELPALIK